MVFVLGHEAGTQIFEYLLTRAPYSRFLNWVVLVLCGKSFLYILDEVLNHIYVLQLLSPSGLLFIVLKVSFEGAPGWRSH